MLRISPLSAVFAFCLLGLLGLWTCVDIAQGPGTPRQEAEARTPDLPQGLSGVPRFLAEARYYIGQRYALKDRFVTWNGAVKYWLFGHSAASRVGIGQNGFLFLKDANAVSITQGAGRMNAAERHLWRAQFTAISEAFAGQGIPFAFVIGPNKHSLYPENLPAWLGAASGPDTRSQDIFTLAREAFGPGTLNTRRVLERARQDYPGVLLYHPTDTHWTELGAAVVLRQVLNDLGLSVPPPVFEDKDLPHSGDLARMIGQQPLWAAQAPVLPREWHCSTPEGTPFDVVTIDPLRVRRLTCGSATGRPEPIVVFHDSFGVAAIPYLAGAFQRVEFIWTDHADPQLAQELGADYALQIMVERKMAAPDPGFMSPAPWSRP